MSADYSVYFYIYICLGEEEVGLPAGGRQRDEEDGAEAYGGLDHQQCQVRLRANVRADWGWQNVLKQK